MARKGQFKAGGGRVGDGKGKHKAKTKRKAAPAKRRRRRNPSAPQAVVMNPREDGHVRRAPRRRAKRRKNPENPAPRRKKRRKTRKNPEMGTFAKVALGIGGAAAGLGIGAVASSAIEAKSTLAPGWNGAIEVVGGMVIGGALSFLYAPLGIALGVAAAGPALVRAGQSIFGVTPPAAAPGLGTPLVPAAPAPRQLAGFGALEMDIGAIKNDDEMMRLARAAATPLR